MIFSLTLQGADMSGASSIRSLLKNKIGLDVESIGQTTVSRAVRHRMAATGINNEDAYMGRVHISQQEMDELIEQVIVPETWFFRNRESFRFLSRSTGALHSSTGRSLLHILSIPCASGEEPYSIAMALLDAGLKPDSFRIDAIDISTLAIKKAEKAIYGENSFRGPDLEFRKQYFEETLAGSILKSAIRKQVTFSKHNFLEIDPSSFDYRYDIIFCRNLLIYLEDSARGRLLRTLRRLLQDEGLLFVGHSEAGLPLLPYFRAIPPLKAFAHRKMNDRRGAAL